MRTAMNELLSRGGAQRMLWAALLLAALISGWRALTLYHSDMSVFFRVSMKSPEAGAVALYYDLGQQFNAKDVSGSIVYGDDKFHDVRLKIPFQKTIYNLRFDPPAGSKGEIVINRVDIVHRSGRILHDIGIDRLKPAHQIGRFGFMDGELHFSVEEKANDPQIHILLDRPISLSRSKLLALVLIQRVVPEFIALFLICVLMMYVWLRWADPMIATAVFLAILAAGWTAYHDFSSVYFRVSMRSAAQGGSAELYYDRGYGLSQEDASDARIHGDDLFHDYTFRIPRGIKHLRFDPLTTAGTVVIQKMEMTDRYGHVLKSFTQSDLSPASEIKALESSGGELKATTTEKATDPQINIKLDEAWVQKSHARSLLHRVMITFLEWSVIFALLFSSIYLWRRKKERICCLMEASFFQEKLPLIYLGCIFGMMIAMAFVGGRNSHPDEWSHILCADYYRDSWLPGAVDDPKVLKTVGGWGTSYLFRVDIVYWFAGKFSSILSGLVNNHYLRVRLFNAMLFCVLGLIASRKTRSAPLLILALVVSPQIWYIFSYFNGDGFAFFVAFLIAWQLIDSDSLTNQYLCSPDIVNKVSGGVLFRVLLGLMLLSKANYYLYVVFVLFVIAWRFVFEKEYAKVSGHLFLIKKAALISGVALCICLPPMVYDQYINDFRKHEKMLDVSENHAAPEFKPSTLRNNISASYRCLRLRDKGVTLQQLFLHDPEWRDFSYKSFFGLYGNMDIHSGKGYYRAVTHVLGAFFLLVFFYAAFTLPKRDGIFILFVFLFVGLAVGQSLYTSWVTDYEPQGRYLFPILPMLIIGLTKLPVSFREKVVPSFSFVFLMLSAWSFLSTALKMIPKLSG